MILDGYTQHGRIEGYGFSYRPALYDEQLEVMRMLAAYPDDETLVMANAVSRHVIFKATVWLGSSGASLEYLFHVCMGWLSPDEGGDWAKDREARDAKNLMQGVYLELTNPRYANRSCEHCKLWYYNEETGLPILRGGEKQPRDGVTLCQTPAGCPKGTPENPKSLSPKNRLAWNHFRGCAATGTFPDDPIVQRNARLIRKAMAQAEKKRGR